MRLVQQSASEVRSSIVAGLLPYRFCCRRDNIVWATAGFAVVKKGRDKKTGQPVAIKASLIAVKRVHSGVIRLRS